MTETYRILVLGDFHYGESYTRAGARVLQEKGYQHSTEKLLPFVEAADHFIVNLETPVATSTEYPSPLQGQKKYIHWSDPTGTPEALRALGVDAVGLANNHTVDLGRAGLEATFATLRKFGIPWFGAGLDLDEARRPHCVELPERMGGGRIRFHAGFQYSSSHERFDFFATEKSPGCAPMSASRLPRAKQGSDDLESFDVGFPHWGANYNWRTPGQYRIAHRMLAKGFDLVMGHGSHAVQEVQRAQQRWIVYGIGNGNFQSGGRWRQFEEERGILPFSFWSMLEVSLTDSGARQLTLKLYPVVSNNAETDFQPGPVSAEQFSRTVQALQGRSTNGWRFDNPARSEGHDSLGYFLKLDLGAWSANERPGLLPPLTVAKDPGDYPVRNVGEEVEDAVIRLDRGKSLGPVLMAMMAERTGWRASWLSPNRAVFSQGDRKFLVDGYIVHESSLGEAFCKDKQLTGDTLEGRDVPAPATRVVDTSDGAVSAAQEVGTPVVIKPTDGNKSRGVTVGLSEPAEIRDAFLRAKEHGTKVLVQQHVEAEEELRIMATKDQAVAVNKRVLPHVTGDGVSTIAQLIEDRNLQRQLNLSLRGRPIPVDAVTRRYLELTGHHLDEVLQAGTTITVRNVGGLGVGGDTYQALDETDERTKRAAVGAIAAIPGLEWGGVDLIIEKDTGRPYVIEINTRAAYGAALFPAYGEPKDVAAAVWNSRVRDTAPAPRGAPEAPVMNDDPVRVFGQDVGAQGGRSLADMLCTSLRRQGYEVNQLSPRVLELREENGAIRWMTRAGMTEHDRSAVTQLMRRYGLVRKLLASAGVPRPIGRRISRVRAAQDFAQGRGRDLVVSPFSSRWGSARTRTVSPGQLSDYVRGSGVFFVQDSVQGVHVRVLATSRAARAILGSREGGSLGQNGVDRAARVAVEAVRAVPELRWAVVDVVVKPERLETGHERAALVEGLSVQGEIAEDSVIIAGDLDDFFRDVAGIVQ